MNERLVDFLYVLMRDHLVPGAVEGIVENFIEHENTPHDNQPCDFTNKGLERYAREIAERLGTIDG